MFLSFFTNTVLLASFIGMSVGCLTAGSRRNHFAMTPLWLLVLICDGWMIDMKRESIERMIDVGNQPAAEMVFFGTENYAKQLSGIVVPIEILAGLFFISSAMIMVGLGQLMGRLFNQIPNRVHAYSSNVFGSLIGIVAFAVSSWYHLSPVVWMSIIALGMMYFHFGQGFTRGTILLRGAFLLSTVLVSLTTSGVTDVFNRRPQQQFWSPYYRIEFVPNQGREWGSGTIVTNLMSHQRIIALDEVEYHYAIPHLLHRDTGGKPFKRAMIIGAGSGNDVSRLVQWSPDDARIDAVEIDPVIQKLGIEYHPNRPYQSEKVTKHLDDGRNFLRSAPSEEYDLVVYALVDSLVLHSGYSNIRLESYLFTEQAFADVKRVLKPDGRFVVYNYFRQGWIVQRLRDMHKRTFGVEPVVLTYPHLDLIEVDKDFEGYTIMIAGSKETLEPLKEKFAKKPLYWIGAESPPSPLSPVGFDLNPPDHEKEDLNKWMGFGPGKIVPEGDAKHLPTDDWPFLYLREPMIPVLTLRGLAIMGLMSVLLWFGFRESSSEASGSGTNSLFRMFFLGAGFMLIETKAVVQMALLFGSTWMVNTVVFFAVLLMILGANLFVSIFKPQRLGWAYAGLFTLLAANVIVPLDAFLGLNRVVQVAASCGLVFGPMLFAGVIFAVSFQRSAQPNRAFGANVAGALMGGFAENASMLLGFQYLLGVAVIFYGLSIFSSSNRTSDRIASNG
jgi:spermidine synthase